MPSDAARLEATGDPEAPLEFRGHPVIIPRAVENWPLDAIRAAAAAELPGRPLIFAVDALLAGQSVGRLACIDDYVELSHRMADAVGVSPLPEAPSGPRNVFGGVPTLLDLLDNNADDLASDLRRFWGVDYLDRWRGEPQLTLRQIWTYVRRLPAAAATARARNGGRDVWTLQHFVTAATYELLARRIYPGRPATAAELERWREAAQKKAEQDAKLRSRQAHYAPSSPAQAAAATARENRLKEMARNGESGNAT